jgi:hypothetical protein
MYLSPVLIGPAVADRFRPGRGAGFFYIQRKKSKNKEKSQLRRVERRGGDEQTLS